MADIKTKDSKKGTIKTINKAAVATERIKSAYAKTKDKAEQGYYSKEDSATEYATDKISGASERAARGGARQFDKRVRKAVKDTRDNIIKAKDKMADFKQKRAESMKKPQGGNATTSPISAKGALQQSPTNARTSSPATSGSANHTAAKSAQQGAGKSIKQSTQSAGKRTIKSTSKTAIKSSGKGAANATGKGIKTAQKTSRAAVKTTAQAAKTAQATARATAKTTKRAAQAAQTAAKTTAKAVKVYHCSYQGSCFCNFGRRLDCRIYNPCRCSVRL